MTKFKRSILILLIAIVGNFAALPASAVRVKDYPKLAVGEQSAYLFGAIEMVTGIFTSLGDDKRAICIRNYFRDNVKAWNSRINVLVKDKRAANWPVAALVMVIVNDECGKSPLMTRKK